MNKKLIVASTAVLLGFASSAWADSYVHVVECTLKDGKTSEEAHMLNGKWLKWARGVAGTDDIHSSMAVTVVGDNQGFRWVDSYPSLVAWATVAEADLEDDDSELSAAFNALADCTRTSLVNLEPTTAAR